MVLGTLVSALAEMYSEAGIMSLTRPIPERCSGIVEAIRDVVPRPVTLPVEGISLRWFRDDEEFCPMGLHPKSKCSLPHGSKDFPGFGDEAVVRFGEWWDAQKDAVAAVDAVWGSE